MRHGIGDKGLKRIAQLFHPDEGAFRLEELSEKAREHAFQQYVEHVSSYAWWDYVYDWVKEDAPPYFNIEDIIFSGFWSQGDGASWAGTVDLLKWCEAHGNETCASLIKSGYGGAHGTISLPRGNYSHSGGMNIEIDYYTDYPIDPTPEGATSSAEIPGADDALIEMETDVLAEAREYADKIYRQLEETYEAETSLEAFKDMVDANEWRFDADGNIV